MPTKQGSLDLINDPVAQKMLQSTLPARFAYNWHDGTTRGVPIGFHWNGAEIVLGTPPDAPKMKALHDGAAVVCGDVQTRLWRGRGRGVADPTRTHLSCYVTRLYHTDLGRPARF